MSHIAVDVTDIQKRNTEGTIIITGAPRSGTTLLGTLISTLGGIEYYHEPPMVWALTALLSMKALSPSVAACLLQLYLHEELFVESVHGRRANLRPSDDSLVLRSIHWEELVARWQTIKNRGDAMQYISDKRLRLAVKTPSILEFIDFLQAALPKSKFIIIIRDGRDVVRSILKKEWLTDEGLKENYWPYKVINGQKLPTFVEDAVADRWAKMNASTRACYLWRRDAEFALEIKDKAPIKDRLQIVFYEKLRQSPDQVMKDLAGFIPTDLTDLTELAIRSVRPLGEKSRQQPEGDFLHIVEPDELHKFTEMNRAWCYD